MQKDEILRFLAKAPLFSKADPGLLEQALDNAVLRCLSVGEHIGDGNEPLLMVLLSGRVKIFSADQEKNVILRVMEPGEVCGAASLFLEAPSPISRIEAAERSAVLLFNAATVRLLLGKDPEFLNAYLAFLAGRVQFLNRKIRCYTAGSAERRLALWLASEQQATVRLPDSITALADTLDIGRASLYRSLDKFEAEGLISRRGREITVISQDELLRKYQ